MVKRTEEKVTIAEFLRRSDAARSQLGSAHAALKRKLDVQGRVMDSINGKPLKWLGGSIAAGLVGSLLLRRAEKKQETSMVKRVIGGSIPGTLLRLGFKLVKPTLQVYATKMFKQYLESRFLSGARAGQDSDSVRQAKNRK